MIRCRIFLVLIFLSSHQEVVRSEDEVVAEPEVTQPPPPAAPTPDLAVAYTIPTIEEHIKSLNVVVDMAAFKDCKPAECKDVCGTTNAKMAYCDKHNKKLCMCDPQNFHPSNFPGTIDAVNRDIEPQKNCSIACNKRDAYGRIWMRDDWSCLCILKQMTPTSITLCDPLAKMEVCKAVCQTDTASCSFNGACLCRKTWESFFNMTQPKVRKEEASDNGECTTMCEGYHHDYVGRIYDSKMNATPGTNVTYALREKFCTCGDWLGLTNFPQSTAIMKQGFQLCTGLKCKLRCGMDEAVCEPNFRRGCLCPRENIIIGNHLWTRLPTHQETKCYETCATNGYDSRVIEWNPFMVPRDIQYEPHYRNSTYMYLYDGKFCHCIKTQIDMHQYRPCTDELCVTICGHHRAECDKRTRRTCFCNTHQLSHALGRRPDPGELNCDISCRYGLFDAKILDLKWDTTSVDSWGVKISKYCSCIRKVSPAGLTHCDPLFDECPKYCGGIAKAYCTKEKYCHCGLVPTGLLGRSPLIRLGTGKEMDECGELCGSWLWPMTEDYVDNRPYIYDEQLGSCSQETPCPKIESSPWKPEKPGKMSTEQDALTVDGQYRRFCLCAKAYPTNYSPGNRFIAHIEPERVSDEVPCPGKNQTNNRMCVIVGQSLHITA